jgi:hypothetical protein
MVLLFRKVQFCVKLLEECLVYREERNSENQSSSKRALCRTQTNVEKWSFLKKFTKQLAQEI